MMRLADIFTRLRRFLRDPSGKIWSDDDLITYWLDAQMEMGIKVPEMLVRSRVLPYPPQWDMSYQQTWERTHCRQESLSLSRPGVYHRAGTHWELRGWVITYPWEPGYRSDDASPADEGYRFTHPWEGHMASPGDPVPLPLPLRCDRILYLGYEEEALAPSTRREISRGDSAYKTHYGEPELYYRPDEYSHALILYPRPSSINWDAGTGTGVDSAIIGETAVVGEADPPEADNLLIIYSELPEDWTSTEQLVDWPGWAVPYLEAGTLERAFGADTDGYIPSLRDYWRLRKEIGFQVLKRWKSKRQYDRDIRVGGLQVSTGQRPQYPRLPSSYDDRWL